MSRLPILDSEAGRAALQDLAAERELNPAGLFELLRVSEEREGMIRRKGLFQAFDAVLDQSGLKRAP